jgi:4'-phosphopantetheinyl transferase
MIAASPRAVEQATRHVVDVWCLAVDVATAVPQQAAGRTALRDPRVRAAAHRFLEAQLALQNVPPLFSRALHGKPRLASVGTPIEFNLSHAGTRSLIALSATLPVGIDIEAVVEVDDETAAAVLSPPELAALHALPAMARARAFTRYFVAKEAILKAAGTGIAPSGESLLGGIEVGIDPGDSFRPLRLPERLGPVADWRLVNVNAGAGFEAALAFKAPGAEVRCHPTVRLAIECAPARS